MLITLSAYSSPFAKYLFFGDNLPHNVMPGNEHPSVNAA